MPTNCTNFTDINTGSVIKPYDILNKCHKTSKYDKKKCIDKPQDVYVITGFPSMWPMTCVTCTPPKKIAVNPKEFQSPDGSLNVSKANDFINDLDDMLGIATSASISANGISGFIQKLLSPQMLTIGYSEVSNEMEVSPDAEEQLGFWVTMPEEAVFQSQSKNNGTGIVAVVRFNNMPLDEKNSSLLKGAVYAITVYAPVNNLLNEIQLNFNNEMRNNTSIYCVSWQGDGKMPNWTTSGCKTVVNNSDIICQCSHLTFFAVLMKPEIQTISSSDLESLTYISYIGCGLSLFFVGIVLFMQFLLRKAKANPSTKILMNLFVAQFLLNLAFLSNEWMTNTNSPVACVFIAVFLHYSLLATFAWFFLQALHIYLQFWGTDIHTKQYMLKICIPAWTCPAIVVMVVGCLGNYSMQIIPVTNGVSPKMCWINNILVQYIVNIGTYVIVFVFTLAIFIVITQRIIYARKVEMEGKKKTSMSKTIISLAGLFSMLGLSWGVAFFSYGNMVVPSYYIFTIINSFQGFFLFIYYYKSSKDINGHDCYQVSEPQASVISSNSCGTTLTQS
ncbi:adhesion G-protein coupled receptor G2-like isoform X2 [Denticeps clupeoides]|nr:adhesion G-protein coupled receptor G2-like isoform X2 [Denticeps clupeoides]